MSNRQKSKLSRQFNNQAAEQNAAVNDSVDEIIESVTHSDQVTEREDWAEIRKTTKMLILNNLLMGK